MNRKKTAYHEWQDISEAINDDEAVIDFIHFRGYKATIDDNLINQGFTDESRYAAFIITDTLASVIFPATTNFEASFSLYRNSLKFGLRDDQSYGSFWQPIDPYLDGISKVYLSPDGIYHKLNPSVFYNPGENNYIADEFDILNITSGKDLLFREPKDFSRNAIIFGNPDFSRLEIAEQLQQLPGAENEARDISNILDVRRWRSETYYLEEATEERIKELNNPGIVHIATHGYFDDDPGK